MAKFPTRKTTMTKHLLVFLSAFAVAAVAVLFVRAGNRDVVAEGGAEAPRAHTAPVTGLTRVVGVEPGASVENAAAPEEKPASAPAKDGTTVAQAGTVNSRCPVCGMDVDHSIKPAEYEGATVGFGCAKCPPKFAKQPEFYGPAALKNEVAKRD